MITARFQTWINGERCFANRIFTNSASVEADRKMSENSFARTEYREFENENEANEWLHKMSDEA